MNWPVIVAGNAIMISLGSEVLQCTPFGRTVLSSVPDTTNKASAKNNNNNEDDKLLDSAKCTQLSNNFTAAELDSTRDLFRSFNDVSICKEKPQESEFWKVRKGPKGEEELYVNENTLICSYKQSSQGGRSFLDKSYTFEDRIIDATWCQFNMSDAISGIATQELSNLMRQPSMTSGDVHLPHQQLPKFSIVSSCENNYTSLKQQQQPNTCVSNETYFQKSLNMVQAVCVLDPYSIQIFSDSGDHYRKALQFEVRKMVPTNFGLLLERVLNDNEQTSKVPFPVLFTLSNPLNEIVPVLLISDSCNPCGGCNTSGSHNNSNNNYNISYFTRLNDLVLVEFIGEKNFVITYSAKTNTHSIFHLRPVNSTELEWIKRDLQKPNVDVHKEPILDGTKQMEIDPDPCSNLISTPISSCDVAKKQCRLSYPSGASSPITRSSIGGGNSYYRMQNSHHFSPLTANSITGVGANVSSPHSGRHSSLHSTTNELSLKRVFSPTTGKISSRISSRIDSPLSPNVKPGMKRLSYFTETNSRLVDSDLETRLNGGTVKSPLILNPSTPTVSRTTSLNQQQNFFEPIIADYSLEFVWTEAEANCSPAVCPPGPACKVFLTNDLLGQKYLCLLIKPLKGLLQIAKSSVLKLIKLDLISDESSNLHSTSRPRYLFKFVKDLPCNDAETLNSLNMMLILDETNSLSLYSGGTKVSMVHLHSNLNVFPTPKCPPNFELDFLSGSKVHTSSPIGSTTQRKKPIVTDCNHSAILNQLQSLDESLPSFSIQQYPSLGTIVMLRDSIDNRVTLKTDDSKLYRLSFPQLTSTFLVDKCLAALRQALPREAAFNLLKYWYSYRNSTNQDENIPEISLFKLCILSLIGYDKDSIKEEYIARNEISCSTVSGTPRVASNSKLLMVSTPLAVGHSVSLEKEVIKKLKIEDEQGTDEDWYSLVNNCTNSYGLNKSDLFVKQNVKLTQTQCRSTPSGKRVASNRLVQPPITDNSGLYPFVSQDKLFTHTPTILYTLHLVYEDLKLVQMNWFYCKSLVDVLYLLAVDLKLDIYQDYYMRDFASVCTHIISHTSRYPAEALFNYPAYWRPEPPSIYGTLYALLRSHSKTSSTSNKIGLVENGSSFPYIGSSGSVMKSITTPGAHIITPNIFNLVWLYSNLTRLELVEPQSVLYCIGNNFCLNSDASSTYLNVSKYRQICRLYGSIKANKGREMASSGTPQAVLDNKARHSMTLKLWRNKHEKILFLLSAIGLTQEYLKELPLGLALPLWDVIFSCRTAPHTDWCSSIYSLIDRPDLLSLEYQDQELFSTTQMLATHNDEFGHLPDEDESELAYLDYSVLRLLFPSDQRLQEAYRMLISSKTILVTLQQRHGQTDQEYAEELEKHLYALCIRSMALPLGRGMVTLRSYTPVVAERFPIPELCLTGRVPPRNTPLEVTHIDMPANMEVWPLFHNGVAAGLRISSNINRMVDSSWILFNKPANEVNVEEHYSHAGFLLALGLNGLLDNLSIMDLHEYLSKGNDLTKVAILLGLAASKRGTMDQNAYVLLGIHLEGLLPSSSAELDVAPVVKVAAVLGVGLLFQGTGHNYIAEVMLNEIGRPPGPEMEHYIDRESYALAAGLALGLVTLGRGNEMTGMVSANDVSLPDQLNHFMLGVHKKQAFLQREKSKMPSYHIREGDCINADVTSPGATLALGMMFFNTGNQAVAQWLEVPTTQNLLETVRPDFILLRVLAKSLVMWANIEPTSQWIESQIPPIIFKNAFQKVLKLSTQVLNEGEPFPEEVDYETMTQAYCNIIAGSCFALALRYAGSADKLAFSVVHKYTIKLVAIIRKGTAAHLEQAGKSTIESCVNCLIVSCAIIMAGTGNVKVMRLCRFLRSRINQCHVLYGSFMAIHMALGLLFLGGCRITLDNSPASVAAMICAFFPKYPIHTYDNRYHLQAFRHLYVLATEPRLLIPRCIDTGTPVYVAIKWTYIDSKREPVRKSAPCILPDLSQLSSVELNDHFYWRIRFDRFSNFNKLRKVLHCNGNLFVKRKVKCLSYNKQIITSKNNSSFNNLFQKIDRHSFSLFDLTNEVILKNFSDIFLTNNFGDEHDLKTKNRLCSILYDCAEDETLELFAPLIKFLASCSKLLEQTKQPHGSSSSSSSSHSVNTTNINQGNAVSLSAIDTSSKMYGEPCGYHKYFTVWQIKFASLFISQSERKLAKFKHIETIRFQLEKQIKNRMNVSVLQKYLRGEVKLNEIATEELIDIIVFYNLPSKLLSTIGVGTSFIDIRKALNRDNIAASIETTWFVYNILTHPT